MTEVSNGIIGIAGCLLSTATAQSNVTTWVSVICSCVIAVVTCGLQVYHMIRDKDKDNSKEDSEDNKDDNVD